MTVLAPQPEVHRRANGQVQGGEDQEDLPPGEPSIETDRERPEDGRRKTGDQREEDDEPSRRWSALLNELRESGIIEDEGRGELHCNKTSHKDGRIGR